jgi:hypothetical protein
MSMKITATDGEIVGFATPELVAHRLACEGDPDSGDFGLEDMGLATDQLTKEQLLDLLRRARDILEERRVNGTLSMRDRRLLTALSAHLHWAA